MKLFEPKVRYDEIQNKYFHVQTGQEFMRVSHVLDSLGPKFDGEGISRNIAKGTGRSQEEVVEGWNQTRDEGTRKHNAIQHFSNYASVRPEDNDLLELSREINLCYKDYYQSYSELTLYNEEARVSGTTDRTNIISNRKSSMFDMEDYKCPKDNVIKDYSKQNEFLHWPLDHLPNCSFTRYTIQLGMYAYMFEVLTGRKCRRLGIRCIHTDNKTHVYMPVPYLKPEVEYIFKVRKEQLIKLNGN